MTNIVFALAVLVMAVAAVFLGFAIEQRSWRHVGGSIAALYAAVVVGTWAVLA